jgi:ATP-dependent 26S proteasome regulatory subunit
MPNAKKRSADLVLRDPTVPMPMRLKMLKQYCLHGEAETEEVLKVVLESASMASAGEQAVAKMNALAEMIDQLEQGPLRCATFDRLDHSERFGPRAQVILPDGGLAYCVVPDEKLVDALRCGDTVWLDAQCRALLFHQPDAVALGEEAQFERRLPDGNVEVSLGEIGRLVCRPTARLRDQMERGEAEPGSTLVVCQRRLLAFYALPPEEGMSHLRFLSSEPVPDVVVERDVGAPPAFIADLSAHVHREMTDPELGRRYRLRRSRLTLATGVAGSGKTHAIKALCRKMYEVISEVTGVPLADLPQRVLQLRASEVLSKWVGGSDRRIARFFDEVEQVADEIFEAPDGRRWQLPVLVIAEEIDALARQRGEDAIHDRIQTTLLTRLDPAHELYRDRIVLVVCTSNVPSLLDVAFVRRAGGTVETFGRLSRRSFRAVLAKQLRDRPLWGGEGAERRLIADLTAWLFAPNASDAGQVEITYVGQPNPVVKHRRDFLTAGLVDRAVQQACSEACDAEWRGSGRPGIDTETLMRAIDAQVQNIVGQLAPGNCDQYLTLPDAVRVGTVRRLEQPAVLPIELERAS